VKWPLAEVFVSLLSRSDEHRFLRCDALVRNRTNVRKLTLGAPKFLAQLKCNERELGKQFGRQRYLVQEAMKANLTSLVDLVDEPSQKGKSVKLTLSDGSEAEVNESHFTLTRTTPPHYQEATGLFAQVFMDKTRSPELDQEGYLREVVRKVQMLRKKAGLKKSDKIDLVVVVDGEVVQKAVAEGLKFLQERAGVVTTHLYLGNHLTHVRATKTLLGNGR